MTPNKEERAFSEITQSGCTNNEGISRIYLNYIQIFQLCEQIYLAELNNAHALFTEILVSVLD